MKKKYLVEVWEHRQVSFEVEAENEDEAKATAEDVYANSDRLKDLMVHDDESIASEEIKVLQCLGEANGSMADENPRHANCYHWLGNKGICSLNGCPCDDLIDGHDCEFYKAKFSHCLGGTDGIIENTGEKR